MLEINPILSILSSLLIINGIYNLAKFVSKSKYLIFLENYAISGRIISFFLIINFLSILLYDFFLLFGINEFYLKTLATLFILIGFYKPDNIQELLKKYIFSCKIRVDLYYTNNYNDMIQVLTDINSTFPLNIENKLLSNINNILTYMKNKFCHPKSTIVRFKKSRRPFINENEMVDKLRDSKFIISCTNLNSIYKKIDKINDEYSKVDNINELRFGNKKITENMWLKAASYSCFLGFDTNFTWIDRIDKLLENKFIKKNKNINVNI